MSLRGPVFGVQGRSPEYALGSPLVQRAVMHLEDGKSLEIRAENQSAENVYMQRVEVNGRELDHLYVTHEELTAGGSIVFFMGAEPRLLGHKAVRGP